MYVELIGRDGQPHRIEISQLALYHDNGTPLAVAVQIDPLNVHVSHVKDPTFATDLTKLGIRKTVVVEELQSRPPLAGSRLWRP